VQGPRLQQWVISRPVDLLPIKALLDDGFGSDEVGEDKFDAVVGLLGMLDVVLGGRDGGTPHADVRAVEGWILGQQA
jgi:hypothetical protein